MNDNDTIFDIVKKNETITLAHSCLSGRCSECKVRVVEGEFQMPNNQEGLTPNEVDNNYCLACITRPLTDLIIDEFDYFEGNLPLTRTLPAKINSLVYLSTEVVKMVLRIPPTKDFEFIPGQYVDLSIKNIKRSYSIASSPGDSLIELLIKKYPNGKFSNYLFNEAKVNDLLRLEGPKGIYILPKDIPSNVLFVSTGTGIAPNLSIIRSAIKTRILDKSQITLIHGQRYASEHIYSLEDILQGIKIIKTISREARASFEKGYVQDVVKNLDLVMSKTMVFACGNPKMIKDLKTQMISMGLEEKNFKSDVFVPTN